MGKRKYSPNFWDNVEKTDTCWLWTAGRDYRGYGYLGVAGKTIGAHRHAWELVNMRVVPSGLYVCHSCDRPRCVNPDHLFLGTPSQNQQDARAKGRIHDIFKLSRSPHARQRLDNRVNMKYSTE